MKKPEKKFFVLTTLLALSLPAVISLAAAAPRVFYVAGGSMEPTLQVRARVPIQKNPYQNIGQVRRGSVIVYSRIEQTSGKRTEAIKRVIGLPGDKVRLSGASIWVNGKQLPHALLRRAGQVSVYRETNGNSAYDVKYGDNTTLAREYAVTVAEGHLLCVGDNRDNSYDSRYTGLVPFSSVVAKMLP